MGSRLEKITAMLERAWEGRLLGADPTLVYDVNRILTRFGRTQETLPELWNGLDSLLFNAVYRASGGSMRLNDATGPRISTDAVRELADRLLALCYKEKDATPELGAALNDLARAGSFAAMRELVSRYPMEPEERMLMERVLSENEENE